MQLLSILLGAVGAGLLVYNLAGFIPGSWQDEFGSAVYRGPHYQADQTQGAAVGAGLLAAGVLLEDKRRRAAGRQAASDRRFP
jgi:hypothetical protein